MNTAIIFIGAIIAAIGATCAALAEDSKGRLAKMSAWAALGGAILSALGGFFSSIEQDQTTQKLLIAQEELISWNSGGDSFPVLMMIPSLKDGVSEIHLRIQGKYPLRDISLQITDINDVKTLLDIPACIDPASADLRERFIELDNRRRQLSIDVALGNTTRVIGEIKPGEHKSLRFLITVLAANGQFNIQYRAIRKGAKTLYANRTTKQFDNDSKILLDEIDPEFPRTSTGDVDWDAEFVKET